MMNSLALRDHARQILRAIADDLRQPQGSADQIIESPELAAFVPDALHTAAEVHGALRAQDGFTMIQLVSEYRAMRSSILQL